jgi:hypothetical protein
LSSITHSRLPFLSKLISIGYTADNHEWRWVNTAPAFNADIGNVSAANLTLEHQARGHVFGPIYGRTVSVLEFGLRKFRCVGAAILHSGFHFIVSANGLSPNRRIQGQRVSEILQRHDITNLSAALGIEGYGLDLHGAIYANPSSLIDNEIVAGVAPNEERYKAVPESSDERAPSRLPYRVLYAIVAVIFGGLFSYRSLVLGEDFFQLFGLNLMLLLVAFICCAYGGCILLDAVIDGFQSSRNMQEFSYYSKDVRFCS